MARFRFKLEPLLKARRAAEETEQRRVARIERERLAIEERLRRQQHLIGAGKDELREHLTGSLHMPRLRGQAASALRGMRQAHRLVLELAGVHHRLEAARSVLLEATKRRRALELLRERRYEQFLADQNRRETDALDELAVIAAARKEMHA